MSVDKILETAHPNLHLWLSQVPAEAPVHEILGHQGHAACAVAVRQAPCHFVPMDVVR